MESGREMIEAEFERRALVPPRIGSDAVRKIDHDFRFEHRRGEWNGNHRRLHVGRRNWGRRAGNDVNLSRRGVRYWRLRC